MYTTKNGKKPGAVNDGTFAFRKWFCIKESLNNTRSRLDRSVELPVNAFR